MSEFEYTPVLDDVSAIIFEEVQSANGTKNYLQGIKERYDRLQWTNLLLGFCGFIEPELTSSGLYVPGPLINTFYDGSLVGLHTAETARGTEFASSVIATITGWGTELLKVDPEDEADPNVVRAASIMELAEEGRLSDDPNLVVVSELEDEICPDLTIQQYTRLGFGVVLNVSHALLSYMTTTEQTVDLEAMQSEIEQTDWDWTAGLNELGI